MRFATQVVEINARLDAVLQNLYEILAAKQSAEFKRRMEEMTAETERRRQIRLKRFMRNNPTGVVRLPGGVGNDYRAPYDIMRAKIAAATMNDPKKGIRAGESIENWARRVLHIEIGSDGKLKGVYAPFINFAFDKDGKMHVGISPDWIDLLVAQGMPTNFDDLQAFWGQHYNKETGKFDDTPVPMFDPFGIYWGRSDLFEDGEGIKSRNGVMQPTFEDRGRKRLSDSWSLSVYSGSEKARAAHAEYIEAVKAYEKEIRDQIGDAPKGTSQTEWNASHGVNYSG